MKSILDTLHRKLKFTRKMLSEIQQERRRKLLCIFDINFAISTTTCYFVHKALCEMRPVKKLDVFLESGGGHLDDGFKLSQLLRAYSPSFSTLIAFRARSAALFTVLSSREKAKSLGLPVFFPDASLSCKLSRLHQAYTDTLLAHGIHSALIIQHEEGLYLTLPAPSPKTASRPQHVSRAWSHGK